MDRALVLKLFSTPYAFASMCQIVREDESIGYLEPTPIQRKVLDAMAAHRWLIVTKHRQAKVTTVMALLLLRDCMYLDGIHGALIAETQATAEDIFERIVYAYNHLPAAVRMPLAPGRKPGVRHLDFTHGGGIKVLTAGSKAPAVGRSIDRLGITEFGEAQWQRKAAINILPTVNKRPNGRVVLESTPGPLGSYHELLWHRALEGGSRFRPLFLDWWTDSSCRVDAAIHDPDEAEASLRAKGAPDAALAFRRLAIRTEFVGDDRLFRSKYPTDPYDGWIGSQNPVMPAEVIARALEAPQSDWPSAWGGLVQAAPDADFTEENVAWLVTVDPAGYGARGDPSALVGWRMGEGKIVDAFYWTDREDPGRLAKRILALQQKLVPEQGVEPHDKPRTRRPLPLIVVESNAPACVQSLRDLGCPNLYWTDRNHPGWVSSAQRLQLAEARLVRGLREGEIVIRTRKVLHQLLGYDGADRGAHGQDERGHAHHFDLARCAVMAAHVAGERRRWLAATGGARTAPEQGEEPADDAEPRDLTVLDLDRAQGRSATRRRAAWIPASARFGPGEG